MDRKAMDKTTNSNLRVTANNLSSINDFYYGLVAVNANNTQ